MKQREAEIKKTTKIEEVTEEGRCLLLASTPINSHIKTVCYDAAYGMPWKTLMKMMTDKYCPRSEIKKLEIEIWNLKVKGIDVVEKYVWGLPDMIQGSMMAFKPKIMQEAIKIANDLMDQKVRAYAERQAENKRKFDNNNNLLRNKYSECTEARRMVYALGGGEINQDIDDMEDDTNA
ncbi:hypothetical protein Tco_0058722 [Tanacetum coccineum]